MCGFFGCIHNGNLNFNTKEFENISNFINHRGPDDHGFYYYKKNDLNFKFSHKRLSIQDLSIEGKQPMFSYKNNYIILFNGEIYNHLKIREDLNKNYKINWRGSSDTETLINFSEHNSIMDIVNQLKGMFSYVILDIKRNKIYFARDIAGEKPLYLSIKENYLSFSSDIKPIINIPTFNKEISLNSLNYFLKLNYIPSPNTIFKNIYKIPPASILEIDLNIFKFKNLAYFNDLLNLPGIKLIKYWSLTNTNHNNLNNKNKLTALEDVLTNSVESQLISDAPLGAFLSGGIDSSLIVSIASKLKKNIDTFTIGYNFDDYDESKHAVKIAKHLNTNHTTHICTKKDVLEKIPFLNDAFTEPFADTSQIPTMLVSQIASRKVKVALSGDGGDELFCGYNRYIITNKIKNLLYFMPFSLRIKLINLLELFPEKLLKVILARITNQNIDKKLQIYLDKIKLIKNNYDLYDQFITEWSSNEGILNLRYNNTDYYKSHFSENEDTNLVQNMMNTDFVTYLPDDILCKVDRASMYYSLETRAPYLDKNVIKFAKNLNIKDKINNKENKVLLRKLLSKYLPDHLIEKKKKGFGIPIGSWLKKDLVDFTHDSLSDKKLNNHGLLNNKIVKKNLNEHLMGYKDNTNKLWSIIQFNNWYEKFY